MSPTTMTLASACWNLPQHARGDFLPAALLIVTWLIPGKLKSEHLYGHDVDSSQRGDRGSRAWSAPDPTAGPGDEQDPVRPEHGVPEAIERAPLKPSFVMSSMSRDLSRSRISHFSPHGVGEHGHAEAEVGGHHLRPS